VLNTEHREGKNAVSAQDSVYEWLRERIASTPRDDGAFLNEGALAEEAGVSRTPVREALLRLEAEGWVQIVPRKGAFVPPISDAEVDAVMHARLLIEDWGVREVCRIGVDIAERLDAIIAEQREHVDDPNEFIRLDREFHRTIVDSAGNAVLANFYKSLRDRQVRMGMRAVFRAVHRNEQVLAEHESIVNALRALDELDAVQAVRDHIESTISVLRSGQSLSVAPLQGRNR